VSGNSARQDVGEERNEETASSKCTKVCGEGFSGRSCAKTILVKIFPNEEPERSVTQEAQNYTFSSCVGRVSVFGRRASGFTVEALDGSSSTELPTIRECNEIPDVREEKRTSEVTLHHHHLANIPIPPLDPDSNILPLDPDSNILLQIERDLTEAHHVHEQRTGPRNSPFAQRLSLGWVILGEVCLGKAHKSDAVNVDETCILKHGRPSTFQQCQNNFVVKETVNQSVHDWSISTEHNRIGVSVFK